VKTYTDDDAANDGDDDDRSCIEEDGNFSSLNFFCAINLHIQLTR
jgi:hypothetical protein